MSIFTTLSQPVTILVTDFSKLIIQEGSIQLLKRIGIKYSELHKLFGESLIKIEN